MRSKHILIVLSVVAALVAVAVVVSAGNPEKPPGPPEKTSSYTLEDVYNRLDAGTAGSQSTWTEPSAGPGSTGYTLNQVMDKAPAVDGTNGAVAADVTNGKTFWRLTSGEWGLQTGTLANADPPCFDNTNRYVDCGNGTVHDTVTNLIWLKNANCFGGLDYAAANNAAAGLEDGECGLTDGSSPGDWRLPTGEEWEATIERAGELDCTNPCLTNTPGTDCYSAGPQPFTGIQTPYWSSSAIAFSPNSAWAMGVAEGVVGSALKTGDYYVWPVRGVVSIGGSPPGRARDF